LLVLLFYYLTSGRGQYKLNNTYKRQVGSLPDF